ncbi:hypothetical protein PP589_gp25 [Pseudoalteromonas phage HS5]|nr:hypothetical protein PP589_gp25 [Pseudoalteromonas phage HS5]
MPIVIPINRYVKYNLESIYYRYRV